MDHQATDVAAYRHDSLRVFGREAMPRFDFILERLEHPDARACRECADLIGAQLRAFAAEAYFLGLLRSHRLARRAASSLMRHDCQAHGDDRSALLELTRHAVRELRQELHSELETLLPGGGA
ncbi:MAG: hypothetical protein OXR73_17315 [Myxococcales bacterium]|nr:hypothetical protein [Myxococcales bacterium]